MNLDNLIPQLKQEMYFGEGPKLGGSSKKKKKKPKKTEESYQLKRIADALEGKGVEVKGVYPHYDFRNRLNNINYIATKGGVNGNDLLDDLKEYFNEK